ncbi:sensor histidine kinase [Calidithermus timidus]|uniref:sensor histidine kinase n=1 Tax=Calidithermus timidus TaxID=307124 RepID=UPI0003624DBB|nr:HAMP domain-containing sensor histidine kinase [Calidithermus timidus]
MSIRLRLALWYGSTTALIVALVALLGWGAYVRGQYRLLDQVLLLSANHVAAGWRAAGNSYVLEADLSELEVAFRLYGPGGQLKRTSRQAPVLPLTDPIRALAQPPVPQRLWGVLPWWEEASMTPKGVTFGLIEAEGVRWRTLVRSLERDGEVLGYLEALTPLGNLDRSVRRLGLLLVALIVLSVLGVLGLSLALAAIGLRPIDRLNQAAQQIARSRDLSRRVEGSAGADELSRLATTFNQMLASLQEADSAQKRFVADASHELRAPLAAIQGNLELLRRYPHMPDAEREKTLQMAEREVVRLSRLVNDLLTLARNDAGLPLRESLVDLKAVAQEALTEARYLLKGQRLEAQSLEEGWVLGERDHLKQLVLILLDNAIKYTPEGGVVRLALQVQPKWICLTVSDTGIGIPAEDLPHIFERFYRADPARSRNKGGSGLGLSIARWIIEQHRGEVQVDSQAGKGTTVVVRLPLQPRPQFARRPA